MMPERKTKMSPLSLCFVKRPLLSVLLVMVLFVAPRAAFAGRELEFTFVVVDQDDYTETRGSGTATAKSELDLTNSTIFVYKANTQSSTPTPRGYSTPYAGAHAYVKYRLDLREIATDSSPVLPSLELKHSENWESNKYPPPPAYYASCSCSYDGVQTTIMQGDSGWVNENLAAVSSTSTTAVFPSLVKAVGATSTGSSAATSAYAKTLYQYDLQNFRFY